MEKEPGQRCKIEGSNFEIRSFRLFLSPKKKTIFFFLNNTVKKIRLSLRKGSVSKKFIFSHSFASLTYIQREVRSIKDFLSPRDKPMAEENKIG